MLARLAATSMRAGVLLCVARKDGGVYEWAATRPRNLIKTLDEWCEVGVFGRGALSDHHLADYLCYLPDGAD